MMENKPKNTHPIISLLKFYLLFFFLAAFIFLVSWASTSYQPGHQAPFLVAMYSILLVPLAGGVYSIYLIFKEKDSSNRIFMIVIAILHLIFIGWPWVTMFLESSRS